MAISVHVLPVNDGWAVKREAKDKNVYVTKKEAIAAAYKISKSQAAGQVVIHERNGSFRTKGLHGLPKVQSHPDKRSLRTKEIERVISKIIRKRLIGE